MRCSNSPLSNAVRLSLLSGMLLFLPRTWARESLSVPSQNVPAVTTTLFHTPFLAAAEVVGASPSESSAEFDASESRTRHAARVNRNIFIVSSSVLAFFDACRLLLQWHISSRRKKSSDEIKSLGGGG